MLDALLQKQSFDDVIKDPNHKSAIAIVARSSLQRGIERLAEDEEAVWSILAAETCVLLGNVDAAKEIAARYKSVRQLQKWAGPGVDAWAAIARSAAYGGDFKMAADVAANLLVDVPDKQYMREKAQEDQSRLYRWLALLAAKRGLPNDEFIAGVEGEYRERVRERIRQDALPVSESRHELKHAVVREQYVDTIARAGAGDFSGLTGLFSYRADAAEALYKVGLLAVAQKRVDVLDAIVEGAKQGTVFYDHRSYVGRILLEGLAESLQFWPTVGKYVADHLTFGAKAVEVALKAGGDETQVKPIEQLLLEKGTDHDKLWELGSVYDHAAMEFARRRDYALASKYAEKKEEVSHAQNCCSLHIFPKLATVAIENGDFDQSEPFVRRFTEENARFNRPLGYDLKPCVIGLWKKGESGRAEKLLESLSTGTQSYVLFSFARFLHGLPEHTFDDREVPQ